ncbi:DnaJ domain-containing protein [Shewanella sp. JL219SE-S6]
MDIWQILGITATQDEAAIKQAYRTQLRDCHPEDNPEGFRALRSAYEQALAAAHPATQQTAAKARVEPLESLFQQLMSMLGNERLRFDNEHWYQWAERVGQSSLSCQAQLSQWVQAEILNWRWLPGQIISHLWHALEWSSLERGDKAQQQRAAFSIGGFRGRALRRWTGWRRRIMRLKSPSKAITNHCKMHCLTVISHRSACCSLAVMSAACCTLRLRLSNSGLSGR